MKTYKNCEGNSFHHYLNISKQSTLNSLKATTHGEALHFNSIYLITVDIKIPPCYDVIALMMILMTVFCEN